MSGEGTGSEETWEDPKITPQRQPMTNQNKNKKQQTLGKKKRRREGQEEGKEESEFQSDRSFVPPGTNDMSSSVTQVFW